MSHIAPSFNAGFNSREYTAHPFNTGGSSYFVWALVLSLALHGLALTVLPAFHFNPEKLATILDVELPLPPKPPAPLPEPPKPIPKQTPAQPAKIAPKPAVTPREALPEPPSRTEPAPPPVISTPQKAMELPAFTTPPPPPEPPKPIGPQDMDAVRGNYANLLGREFAKHKQYPRLAQMRGWQGTVMVQLQIDGSGTLISSSISTSSGYEVLDKQALDMVKKATPLPAPPEALREHEFTIHVPVVFRLE